VQTLFESLFEDKNPYDGLLHDLRELLSSTEITGVEMIAVMEKGLNAICANIVQAIGYPLTDIRRNRKIHILLFNVINATAWLKGNVKMLVDSITDEFPLEHNA